MSGEAENVPSELVADKYQLTRLLGRGGMGSVWEGVHTSLGTRVAVKFIESEYADSPDARNRFVNEARAAATLKSKHVVQVYDHGVMPDGRPYIVMEFLAGEPLDARLEKVGRLSPHDTTRIMLQVARALAKAHQAGIVHRDLKPENVFLVWDDEDNEDVAKVVDFGIAKFTNASMAVSSATRTGSVLGTPYFMSPEQARGLRSVDHRTDLWALGVITYRCLVGALPFTGEAVGDLLVKICTAPVPVPSHYAPDLPPAFDAWFARALDREPNNRYPSALEMVEALAACFSGRVGSYADRSGAVPQMMGQTPGPAFQTNGGSGGYPVQPNYTTPMPNIQTGPGVQTGPGMHPGMHPGPGGMHPGPGMAMQSGPGMGMHTPGRTAQVQTGAPLNVTPPPGVPKKSNAPIIVALLVVTGLLVVGIGGVAVALTATGGGQSVATEGTEGADEGAKDEDESTSETAEESEKTSSKETPKTDDDGDDEVAAKEDPSEESKEDTDAPADVKPSDPVPTNPVAVAPPPHTAPIQPRVSPRLPVTTPPKDPKPEAKPEPTTKKKKDLGY